MNQMEFQLDQWDSWAHRSMNQMDPIFQAVVLGQKHITV